MVRNLSWPAVSHCEDNNHVWRSIWVRSKNRITGSLCRVHFSEAGPSGDKRAQTERLHLIPVDAIADFEDRMCRKGRHNTYDNISRTWMSRKRQHRKCYYIWRQRTCIRDLRVLKSSDGHLNTRGNESQEVNIGFGYLVHNSETFRRDMTAWAGQFRRENIERELTIWSLMVFPSSWIVRIFWKAAMSQASIDW